MNPRSPPVRVADMAQFDTLIDARSPSEFALDRIPGAINCPVLDDAERRQIGTLYKQTGAFEARRLGGAMVAANLARHLRERFADRPPAWKPLVYCWRGGLRSASMVQWLRLVGWDAQQLAGGYKSYRRHVVERLAELVPQLRLTVVCGATGSAKTRVLQALGGLGAQVLDLEGCAEHKGSLLGGLPGIEQPSQKRFESRIATVLDAVDPARPVFVEGESARIGRVAVPLLLVDRMRGADCVEIVASPAARLAYLLRDYTYLGDDPDALADRLAALTELHGRATIERWQGWARAGELAPLFEALMSAHYDPHYARSQARHFARWAERARVETSDLSDAAIDRIAGRLLADAAVADAPC